MSNSLNTILRQAVLLCSVAFLTGCTCISAVSETFSTSYCSTKNIGSIEAEYRGGVLSIEAYDIDSASVIEATTRGAVKGILP